MELTAAEVWTRILESARAQLPEQTYRTWLARTEPVALSQDMLAVATDDEFAAEWIGDKYGGLLGDVAEHLFGRRLAIQFHHREPGADAAARPARPRIPAPAPSAPLPRLTDRPPPGPGAAQGGPGIIV